MWGLSFINNIRDLAVSEIWILTDSRSSIQHLSNWPSMGDSTSRSILHLFQQLSDRHPIHLQWVPSLVGLLRNEVADDLAKADTSNPVDPENHMVLTSKRNDINVVQFSDKSTEDFPVICYTDGSKIDGRVGFALVVFRSGVESENFQFRIRDECTVFVAELLCLNFAV
ncbi:RNase H domain-containing protein [Trichonephila clavipes]|nr:RNase H domain-containing protein [Trichonephila clavipes]